MGMLRPAFTRQDTYLPRQADGLADLVLLDQDGERVRLGDLWREQPAVLVWLRHYG